jgi:hypothetical protein
VSTALWPRCSTILAVVVTSAAHEWSQNSDVPHIRQRSDDADWEKEEATNCSAACGVCDCFAAAPTEDANPLSLRLFLSPPSPSPLRSCSGMAASTNSAAANASCAQLLVSFGNTWKSLSVCTLTMLEWHALTIRWLGEMHRFCCTNRAIEHAGIFTKHHTNSLALLFIFWLCSAVFLKSSELLFFFCLFSFFLFFFLCFFCVFFFAFFVFFR